MIYHRGAEEGLDKSSCFYLYTVFDSGGVRFGTGR